MLFSHGNQPAVAAVATVSAASTTTAAVRRGARNCGGLTEETAIQLENSPPPPSLSLKHTGLHHEFRQHTHAYMHTSTVSNTGISASSHRQTHSLNHKGKHETCCLQPQGHGSNVRKCLDVNEKKLAQGPWHKILWRAEQLRMLGHQNNPNHQEFMSVRKII